MSLLSAEVPPPYGPWTGLALAGFFIACALILVRLIRRAYGRDPRTKDRPEPPPPWWRIRAIGYLSMTAVPMTCAMFCFGFSMIGYAAFAWSSWDAVGVATALAASFGVGCVLWGLYDSLDPHAWRGDDRDEYRLW